MGFVDRILTIVITATVTSMVWIVAGGSLIELAENRKGERSVRPAEAAPSPSATQAGDETSAAPAQPLDTPDTMASAESSNDNLVVPVMNVRRSDLTDTFTDARGGGERIHEAIDIMAPKGTTVVASAPGTVEKLFFSEAGGKTIYVRSPDKRTIHYYAHLDEYAEGLKEGQRVRRGQRLGTVGSSGNASEDAPHLHYAILQTSPDATWWEPAKAVNPYPMLTGTR